MTPKRDEEHPGHFYMGVSSGIYASYIHVLTEYLNKLILRMMLKLKYEKVLKH